MSATLAAGNGSLDASELQNLAYALGMVWSKEQTWKVLAAIDADGSGTVDLGEFSAWLQANSGSVADGSLTNKEQLMLKAKLAAKFYQRRAASMMAKFKTVRALGCPHDSVGCFLIAYTGCLIAYKTPFGQPGRRH